MNLRNADLTLYEQLSVPPPSVPKPPPPLEHDGSYPEDQEHGGDEVYIDSSLSVDEVVTQIANGVLQEAVDFSGDEDEGVNGF